MDRIACPKCRAPMERVEFASVEVDRCSGCKGLFFDAREVERLRAVKGSEAIDVGDADVGRSMNARDRIRCPRDTTPMIRVVDPHQSHIWTETCPVCFGSFFDAGEFRDLKQETLLDVVRTWLKPARR